MTICIWSTLVKLKFFSRIVSWLKCCSLQRLHRLNALRHKIIGEENIVLVYLTLEKGLKGPNNIKRCKQINATRWTEKKQRIEIVEAQRRPKTFGVIFYNFSNSRSFDIIAMKFSASAVPSMALVRLALNALKTSMPPRRPTQSKPVKLRNNDWKQWAPSATTSKNMTSGSKQPRPVTTWQVKQDQCNCNYYNCSKNGPLALHCVGEILDCSVLPFQESPHYISNKTQKPQTELPWDRTRCPKVVKASIRATTNLLVSWQKESNSDWAEKRW